MSLTGTGVPTRAVSRISSLSGSNRVQRRLDLAEPAERALDRAAGVGVRGDDSMVTIVPISTSVRTGTRITSLC